MSSSITVTSLQASRTERENQAFGEATAITAKANAVLTDLVLRVERGELKADPKHITELRLN